MEETFPTEITFEESTLPEKRCGICLAPVEEGQNYCVTCGNVIPDEKKEALRQNSIVGVTIFFGLLMMVQSIFRANDFDLENWQSFLAQDAIFIVLTLGFVLTMVSNAGSLYSIRNLRSIVLLQASLLAIFFALAVIFFVDHLFQNLGVEDITYWPLFQHSPSPQLIAIVTICIIPGIFEELAFRGYIHGTLSKVMSPAGTIIVTSLMFALIHISPISFLWLFPLGMFLSYLRWKYNNLWYGMITHAFYNGMILYVDSYN